MQIILRKLKIKSIQIYSLITLFSSSEILVDSKVKICWKNLYKFIILSNLIYQRQTYFQENRYFSNSKKDPGSGDIFSHFERLMPFCPLFPCVLSFDDTTWSKGTHDIKKKWLTFSKWPKQARVLVLSTKLHQSMV